jgi:hypothetical protein
MTIGAKPMSAKRAELAPKLGILKLKKLLFFDIFNFIILDIYFIGSI